MRMSDEEAKRRKKISDAKYRSNPEKKELRQKLARAYYLKYGEKIRLRSQMWYKNHPLHVKNYIIAKRKRLIEEGKCISCVQPLHEMDKGHQRCGNCYALSKRQLAKRRIYNGNSQKIYTEESRACAIR